MRSARSSRGLNESQRLSDMRSRHRCIGVAEDTLLFLLELVDDYGETGGEVGSKGYFMCAREMLTGPFRID